MKWPWRSKTTTSLLARIERLERDLTQASETVQSLKHENLSLRGEIEQLRSCESCLGSKVIYQVDDVQAPWADAWDRMETHLTLRGLTAFALTQTVGRLRPCPHHQT
jgi:hypothetical protein